MCGSPQLVRRAGAGPGDLLPSPPHPLPSPRGRPLGSGCRRPSRAARSSPLPGRPRSPAAGNSEALHHPGAARSPRLPRLPKESHMPAGRAARPPRSPPTPAPSRLQPGPAATSGRAKAGRPPLPAPRAQRNAWQPRPGAIFSGKETAQPRCFLAFSWPPARQPGPSAARAVERGSRVGEVEGGREEPRSGRARAPAPGPGGARQRCGRTLLGRGRAAGLCKRAWLPAAAATQGARYLRPSSSEHGWPGHSLPSDGLRPYWMALLRTSGQSLASISLPVNWG